MAGILPVSDEQIGILEEHFSLLLRWNRRLNLTTITDMEEAVERHYAESLFLAAHVSGGSVYDIGSGAGFPGFPIAVARPEARVSLVESDQRKAAFLREASDLVGNIRVICARGSDLAEPADWVVGRAVRLEDLLEPAARIAARIAVLVGVNEKDQLLLDNRVASCDLQQLPWGEARWLVTADLNRSAVSRGT